jgi:hypothetical protein
VVPSVTVDRAGLCCLGLLVSFVADIFWGAGLTCRCPRRYIYIHPNKRTKADLFIVALLFIAAVMGVQQARQSTTHEIFSVKTVNSTTTVQSPLGYFSLSVGRPIPRRTYDPFDARSYAFCGYEINGLSLLDLALISHLVYFPHESTSFRNFESAFWDTSEWVVAHGQPEAAPGAKFVDLYNKKHNFSVVAVRGTNPSSFFDGTAVPCPCDHVL